MHDSITICEVGNVRYSLSHSLLEVELQSLWQFWPHLLPSSPFQPHRPLALRTHWKCSGLRDLHLCSSCLKSSLYMFNSCSYPFQVLVHMSLSHAGLLQLPYLNTQKHLPCETSDPTSLSFPWHLLTSITYNLPVFCFSPVEYKLHKGGIFVLCCLYPQTPRKVPNTHSYWMNKLFFQ